jgi:polyhydroxyalkanoate synthesis regulator phasin
MNFFEKYRLENVGPTRARLAELISIFESERETMTIRELEELREEIDELTERLRAEREQQGR